MSCVATLKKKGLKVTPQRRLIVDVIHDADTHITAEEIIAYVQSKMPGIHKSTIYRTLDLLEEFGCVFKSELSDQTVYHHAEDGHHHHLICSRCGCSMECDESLFRPVEITLKEKHGFIVDFRHMVMNGICEDCRKKRT